MEEIIPIILAVTAIFVLIRVYIRDNDRIADLEKKIAYYELQTKKVTSNAKTDTGTYVANAALTNSEPTVPLEGKK